LIANGALPRAWSSFTGRLSREFVIISAARLFSALMALLTTRILTTRLSLATYGEQTLIVGAVGLAVTLGLGPLVNSVARFYYDVQRRGQGHDLAYYVLRFYVALTLVAGVVLMACHSFQPISSAG
jgi:hypothetical protein